MDTDKTHDHLDGNVCSNPACSLHNPSTAKKFWEAAKAGENAGYIKVHIEDKYGEGSG